MDYQVFLVRPSGLGTGRVVKGVTRFLRVLDNGISISSALPSCNGTSVEYSFECMSNVLPSLDDDLEFKFDVVNDNNGKSESLKFSCYSRSALLTSILNKKDDIDSAGMLAYYMDTMFLLF